MKRLVLAAAVATISTAAFAAHACDLQMQSWHHLGKNCQALVGYYNGQRVGQFHTTYGNDKVYAGTCEGFVGVVKVDGNVVYLSSFNSYPARQITLNNNCLGSL